MTKNGIPEWKAARLIHSLPLSVFIRNSGLLWPSCKEQGHLLICEVKHTEVSFCWQQEFDPEITISFPPLSLSHKSFRPLWCLDNASTVTLDLVLPCRRTQILCFLEHQFYGLQKKPLVQPECVFSCWEPINGCFFPSISHHTPKTKGAVQHTSLLQQDLKSSFTINEHHEHLLMWSKRILLGTMHEGCFLLYCTLKPACLETNQCKSWYTFKSCGIQRSKIPFGALLL